MQTQLSKNGTSKSSEKKTSSSKSFSSKKDVVADIVDEIFEAVHSKSSSSSLKNVDDVSSAEEKLRDFYGRDVMNCLSPSGASTSSTSISSDEILSSADSSEGVVPQQKGFFGKVANGLGKIHEGSCRSSR